MTAAVQDTLLPGVVWPEPIPEPEPLSPDRRRTQRQRDQIAAGVHPLIGGPLHALADAAACSPDAARSAQPFTCGSCRFRQVLPHHDRAYPKCLWDLERPDQDGGEQSARYLSDVAHVSHGPATDVRAWWPACQHYEAGDAGVSADAARMIPRPHDTPAILAAVAADPLPSRQTDREHIEAAIVACAAEHGGLVTAAWVRPHITRDVMPQMVGATLCPRAGFLVTTDRHPVRNEGGSGNANKWSPVYRYVTA